MIVHIILLLTIFNLGNSVVELGDKDIDSKLKGKMALVMFYSPNCGHCQRLKPTYEKLGNHPEIVKSGVIIGKVDCTSKGQGTCSKYGVRGYPTVKFISRVDGPETLEDYEGNRQLDDLVQFVTSNAHPLISELKDSEIESFIKSVTKPVVVGFFKDSKSKLMVKLLSEVQKFRKNYIFGYTYSADAAKKLKQSSESIVLYRQQQYKSPAEEPFVVEKSGEKIHKFLEDNKHSLVDIRQPKTESEFSYPLIVAFVPVDPHLQKSAFKRIRNLIVRFAKEEKDVHFAISLSSEYKEFISEFAPKTVDTHVNLIAYDNENTKYTCKESAEIDKLDKIKNVLEKFVSDFKKGDVLEKYIKSEEIPDSDDGHVKIVVAKNFDQIVMDDDKDVLIEFYAPWCGHCKKLAPAYRELAKLLKDEDNIVIAKMDATANEVAPIFKVEGFPTIYLAKAGKKSSPIAFSGKRDVAGMLAWLKKQVTHKIKYDGPVTEPKEEL